MELIPHTPTPLIQFAEFDVFFLSSREDPNPLVVLESGKLGKPVLCFKGSGATDEIVEAGGGTMVTMESIEEMSLAIVQYSKNPNLLAQHSQRIENIISETYSKQHILAKITESVKNSTLK
jgi:glycosyltransferase involved in cell wall biosynthesis